VNIDEIRKKLEEIKKLPPEKRREELMKLYFELDELEKKLSKEVENPNEQRPRYLPAEEFPGYVKSYLLLTDLEATGYTETTIEGRKHWIVEVKDEGTGELVRILVPWAKTKDTEIVTITNKRGEPVQVCAYRGEVEELYIVPPKIETVRRVLSNAQREARVEIEVPYEAQANVNWVSVTTSLNLAQSTAEKLAKAVERREEYGIKYLLETLRKTLEDVIKEVKLAPVVYKTTTDIKVARILTEGIIEDLWARFCTRLGEHGINCEPYRDLFERYISWDMNPAEAENVVLSLAKDIIEEELAKRREKALRQPRIAKVPRLNWKHVSWAVAKILFDLTQAKEEAEKKNATGVYRNVEEVLKTIDTVLRFFGTK